MNLKASIETQYKFLGLTRRADARRWIPAFAGMMIFLFGSVFQSIPTYAQGAAPAMFGVQEIVVQYAHFSDPKSSDFCGLTRENVMHSLVKTLMESGINAMSAGEAKPPMMGIARINLIPEISTVGDQSLDCTSFISLSAQTQSNVRVPPVDTLRNVTVQYWQQGALIASSQSLHAQQVDSFLQKMAAQLAQQYHIDQPKQ